jgi:hypothetical protein
MYKRKEIFNIKVKAYLTHVKTDGTLYYLSCPDDACKKKIMKDESNNNYPCAGCNKVHDDVQFFF